LATNIPEGPDCDFTASGEPVSIPAGVIAEIEDPEQILQVYWTQDHPEFPNDYFYAAGKTAYVNLIKANFTEDSEQKYGFDDYTGGEDCVHKSVRVSYTEPIKAITNPTEKANKIYFSSADTGKLTVSPAQAGGSPENLTLSGVSGKDSFDVCRDGSYRDVFCVVAVSILCSGQLDWADVDEDAGEKEQRLAEMRECGLIDYLRFLRLCSGQVMIYYRWEIAMVSNLRSARRKAILSPAPRRETPGYIQTPKRQALRGKQSSACTPR
jgi:hypothetical protein